MTINEFVKTFKSIFPNAEYKATSPDGVVFKSSKWKVQYDDNNNRQIIPYVAKPVESKRGRKS